LVYIDFSKNFYRINYGYVVIDEVNMHGFKVIMYMVLVLSDIETVLL